MPRRAGELDVLVVGTGIAGLSTAIALSGHQKVAVVSKEIGGGGSTQLAQGGIAAALSPGDSPRSHATDTVAAGAGLGDPDMALAVASEAVDVVAMLAKWGVCFDPDALATEGGHSYARVAHARGDSTGAEITRALMSATAEAGVPIRGDLSLVDLLRAPDGTGVVGALVWDAGAGALRAVHADNVVLATGGYGQLWACTTSAPACTGDGLGAAMRAGAQVADLELVQFHPTGMDVGRDPRPLASEALRGAGARLRDSQGQWLNGQDGDGDLAPRDVVSRQMAVRMAELGSDHCYLDATVLGAGLAERFPTFVAACARAGIDPERHWVPVSPTTHYTMGGVLTDADGRTTLEGLLAVGEVASSGLHGANRLASNSLLEGAVMARRAAAVVTAERGPVAPRPMVAVPEALPLAPFGPHAPEEDELDRSALRRIMQDNAGVARNGEGLGALSAFLARPRAMPADGGPARREMANMVLLARTVAALAARRRESRGAHWRTDFPEPRPEWQVRQVAQVLECGDVAVGDLPVLPARPADVLPGATALPPGP